MKRITLFLLALVSLALASCGRRSPLDVSEKDILKQCNNELFESGTDSVTVNVTTGYYELNDFQGREMLSKLAAANVVTYDVERFAWWEKHREKKSVPHTVERYDWWYGYYTTTEYTTKWVTSYEFKEHFMVNVALTDKATSYALDHTPLPKRVEKEDKDMIQPNYVDSIYPENQVNYSENWPEIKHPLADETYNKCKKLLEEANTLLAEASDSKGYSKVEQKLNAVMRVDNFDCMTVAQKAEITSEHDRLNQLLENKKGDDAYAASKRIIEEATTLLNAAENCPDITKVTSKLAGLWYVEFKDYMRPEQSSEIESLNRDLEGFIDKKKYELGCNPQIVQEVEPEEEEIVEEEEPVNDERDPQAIAYEKAKSQEFMNNSILFAFVRKAIVARDIQIIPDAEGMAAKAEVIYEIRKVTDAARVLLHCIDGVRMNDDVVLTYYCDKGWVLEEK